MVERSAKQILMLVNTHVYDDPRVINEAVSLANNGHRIRIIGAARLEGVPTQKPIGDIEVILTPMVSSKNPIGLIRALWMLVRGVVGDVTHVPPSRQTNLISMIFFTLWVLRLGWRFPADVVHAHDLSPLPGAWILAQWRQARLVYDSHEDAAHFYSGRKGQLMRWLEKRLIGKADVVITVGERLARDLAQRGAKRVEVVGNWKRLEDYAVSEQQLQTMQERFQLPKNGLAITYIGNLMATTYQLQPLLEAVEQCPKVTLFIGGLGNMEAQIIAAAARCQRIHWLGWVEIADVPVYTHLASVIYCCLHPDFPQVDYVAPNKLFEAFAAGKALIARRGLGEIGEILEQIPAGILLDDVTPETLKAAFQELQNPERLKALQGASLAARDQYNWAEAERRLIAIYDQLNAVGTP